MYLYAGFNDMAENLQNLIEQVYQQKILTQNAELKQLQAQINPHFLYNSFFLLPRMIKREDIPNAAKFSKMIGDYFQFITRNSETEVTLSGEAAHARIYTDIQALRFEGRIRAEFGELPAEMANIYVPKLILQPIIENAFEHGLKNKASGGLLAVAFQKIENGFMISINDNGDELPEDELDKLNNALSNINVETENTGLINIHRRIRLMYGGESGIRASRSEMGGLNVTIAVFREARAINNV
jgi:two-component system sensor histidine kinase YesM